MRQINITNIGMTRAGKKVWNGKWSFDFWTTDTSYWELNKNIFNDLLATDNKRYQGSNKDIESMYDHNPIGEINRGTFRIYSPNELGVWDKKVLDIFKKHLETIKDYSFCLDNNIKQLDSREWMLTDKTFGFYHSPIFAFGNWEFPNSLTEIGRKFFHSQSLSSVVFNGATKIGDHCFFGNHDLKEVTFNNIVTIGAKAFANCVKLVSVNLENSVLLPKNESGGAFANTNLSTVTIPSSWDRIPDEMFQNCKNLKTLDLSKFKGKIGNSAFFGCEQLSEIIWGPGPYELGDRSFAFTGISELDIDDKFLSIDDAAFVGIQSLKKVYFNSDKCIMGNGVFRETSPCHYYFNGMHPLNSHIICTMPISDIHLHFQNKDVYVSPSMLYDLSKLEDSSNVQQIATITKEVTYPTEQTNFFNHYWKDYCQEMIPTHQNTPTKSISK